jgi:hypothetical protein
MANDNRWSNQLVTASWADIVTVSEAGASGSVAVQLKFVHASGVQINAPVTGRFYMSDLSSGLSMDVADTGIAALTNGAVRELDASHTAWQFVTSAVGLLGVTITSGADSHWLVFQSPYGGLIITDELIID